ncbi:DNA-binding protein SMUBP-2 [Varanus komodoensis]|nr:DNA-binding protein SMUBP-2 [Varanus komodoensis]
MSPVEVCLISEALNFNGLRSCGSIQSAHIRAENGEAAAAAAENYTVLPKAETFNPSTFSELAYQHSQGATEGNCLWKAIPGRKHSILAYSTRAALKGLSLSLMERLIQQYGDRVVKMLTVQYRMHQAIMQWASTEMYNGCLSAHCSVAQHLLKDLPGVTPTDETSIPLLLIDTAGCGLFEMEAEDEQSKGNQGEVRLVSLHIQALVDAGVKARDVAVITPYNLQVDMLREVLGHKYPELEIKSVDGFQGREKEAVILSFVRSNRKGEVGFLAEDRRINVAITRARRHVTVICDSRTTGNHSFLKRLLDYMNEQGEVRTAFEYLDDIVPENYAPKNSQGLSEQERRLKCNISPAPKADGEKPRRKPAKQMGERPAECSVQSVARVTAVGPEVKESSSHHKARILEFLDSSETQLDFPSLLNAHDRLLIHQLAEECGLQHVSIGEGRERYISVRRKAAATNFSLGNAKACQEELPNRPPSPPKQNNGHEEQRGSGAGVGKVDLKTLHMERLQREKAKKEEKAKQHPELATSLRELTGKKHKSKGKRRYSSLWGFPFCSNFCLNTVFRLIILCCCPFTLKAAFI